MEIKNLWILTKKKLKRFFLFLQKKDELTKNLNQKYWKEISRLYQEKYAIEEVNEHLKKRISWKLINALKKNVQEQEIIEIINDDWPFNLEVLPDWFFVKERDEKEMENYIDDDVSWKTCNWNHDVYRTNSGRGRIKFVSKVSAHWICFSVMKWKKIVWNRLIYKYPDIKNCMRSWYVAIDKEYESLGLSKHMLYDSIEWCQSKWIRHFHISKEIKSEWRWYVVHNYRKLSKLFPNIIFIQDIWGRKYDINTWEELPLEIYSKEYL